ncbi:MAG: hypothetical protein QXD05_00535 [Candidatus Pacearchaeota archaeon]
MFGKKRCKNCGKKIEKDFNFCPYCRVSLKKYLDEEDWGLLGRDDFVFEEDIKLPPSFNALFNSLIKSLNVHFKESGKLDDNIKKGKITKGIGISIYASGNNPPEIRVTPLEDPQDLGEKREEDKTKNIKLPKSNVSKFVGLPKKEPETTIKRLSNKVIYEINLPGVKSIKDVSIAQLENSIEIKALAKGKVFHKIIPINLPIKGYNLLKEKLVLELDER